MLRTTEGKRLKANGFRSLAAVKAQFRKAGHVPGLAKDLIFVEVTLHDDFETWQWVCECGAKLRFQKKGKKFNRVEVFELPSGAR